MIERIWGLIRRVLSKEISSDARVQFLRYGFVAVASLVVDFSTLVLCKELLQFNYLIAASCGFALGLVANFALSIAWVFPKRDGSRTTEFLTYAAIGLIGLGMTDLLLWVLTGLVGVHYIISKIAATLVVYFWNFFARKMLLYK